MVGTAASREFAARIGVRYPICQAPMAGTSTPELAAAVSNAGALGSLGIGAASVTQAKEMIARTRQLTDRPFNVNLFCHQPAEQNRDREAAWLQYLSTFFKRFGVETPEELDPIDSSFRTNPEMFDLLLDEKPAIVSFHFGVPDTAQISALKDAGICTFATATSLREAEEINAAGIDVVVAQGVEAGGHRGVFDAEGDDQRLTTSVLVRVLVEKQPLPVIAAGGIMDGAGIRAALDLGAVAVQMGTAFVLCPESAANSDYRTMLSSERAHNTVHTTAFTGRPARGIANEFTALGRAPGAPLPPAYPLPTSVSRKLCAAAAASRNLEFCAFWAGQGAPLAREEPAGELIRTLVAEVSAG